MVGRFRTRDGVVLSERLCGKALEANGVAMIIDIGIAISCINLFKHTHTHIYIYIYICIYIYVYTYIYMYAVVLLSGPSLAF